MPLTEGQVQVRALVMGEGTSYRMLEFNPFKRDVRANETDDRAWDDGSWSGAERTDEAVVPMLIRVNGDTAGGWMTLHHQLAAAFAASHEDIELRWVTAGVEYMLKGRPRMVDPDIRALARGSIVTKAAFVALDPVIYSGELHTESLVLPTVSGGLTAPFTAPVTSDATVLTGRKQLTNAGTKTTGLLLRVDGPVPDPRITVLANEVATTLTIGLTLEAGQWLDIDTRAETVYINGSVSRSGLARSNRSEWPQLPSGSWDLSFDASSYDAAAQLAVSWRDAWY